VSYPVSKKGGRLFELKLMYKTYELVAENNALAVRAGLNRRAAPLRRDAMDRSRNGWRRCRRCWMPSGAARPARATAKPRRPLLRGFSVRADASGAAR
jgi:hypothetical protein